MGRIQLRAVWLLAAALLLGGPAAAAPIFAPGDSSAILGIQVVGGDVNVGTSWPGAEEPLHAIDGVGQKYLNFGELNTGILITPGFGSSIALSMTVWTANDAEERDPASFDIRGTNVAINLAASSFLLSDFVSIASGSLSLPSTRNAGGSSPLDDANSVSVTFANTLAYTSYLIFFPTVKNAAAANSMQIGEVQLSTIPEPSTALLGLMGLTILGISGRRSRRP